MDSTTFRDPDTGIDSNGCLAQHERAFRDAYRVAVTDIYGLAESLANLFGLRCELKRRVYEAEQQRLKATRRVRRPFTDDKMIEARRLRGNHHGYRYGRTIIDSVNSLVDARAVLTDWLAAVTAWVAEVVVDGSRKYPPDVVFGIGGVH